MTKRIRTKPTGVGTDKLYLAKAEKFLNGSRIVYDRKNWESAACLAIHSIISSCDAVTARFLNERHAGSDHMGVLDLLIRIPVKNRSELKQIKRRVGNVLAQKTNAEYGDKHIKQNDSRNMLTEASRVLDWAKSHFV